jgi:hypothetical protein
MTSSKWAPLRKIKAAFVALLGSTAGVTLIDQLVHAIPTPWSSIIVGAVTVATGYLVPEPSNTPPRSGA